MINSYVYQCVNLCCNVTCFILKYFAKTPIIGELPIYYRGMLQILRFVKYSLLCYSNVNITIESINLYIHVHGF